MSAESHPSTLIQEAKLLKKAYFEAAQDHRNSQQFNKVMKIVENVTLQNFKIPQQFPKVPTEGVIYTQAGLRVSLFFLPKGTKTLLHDHPQMYVINKVLKGSFKKSQYSLETLEYQQKIPQQFINNCNPSMEFQFPTITANKIVQNIGLGNIDVITPEDNLHRFETEEDSIFIDVIAPDYDDVNIFFNTYQELDCLCNGKARLQMGPPKLQQNIRIKIEMNQ